MAEGGLPTIVIGQEEYPPPYFPTIFADGVLNLAPSPQVVKFYLQRLMPNLTGKHETLAQPCAQVVMPLEAFVQTVVFFEHTLNNMLRTKVISPEYVERLRENLKTAWSAENASAS